MKTYRCIMIWKTLIMFAFIMLLSGFVYVQSQFSLEKKLFGLFTIIFFAFGLISLFYVKVIVTDIKMVMDFDLKFYKVIQGVEWIKITQIDSDYFFFPQIGVIKIKCPFNSGQQKIEIPITFFPSGLLKDIFNNAPRNVEINLYPWLQKQLNAK